MNKPPAFQFYPKDFVSDMNVKTMTLEERGAYMTLLCHVWLENGIRNDLRVVKGCLDHPQNADEIWENIKHCFYVKKGRVFHKRLDKERRKQKEWREKSRQGGLKSAESRRIKDAKGGSTTVQPKNKGSLPNGCNQSPTLQSSSSSSSSANKKNKNILYEKEFEIFWSQWPSEARAKKSWCQMKFNVLCKAGKLEEFKRTTLGYSAFLTYQEEVNNFPQRCMNSSTWLNGWEGDKEKYINFKSESPL